VAISRVVTGRDTFAIPPDAIAYAVEQPADVDVNEIVVRPTAQPSPAGRRRNDEPNPGRRS
jgi:hypothetical protein